jgi:hypothetical protein
MEKRPARRRLRLHGFILRVFFYFIIICTSTSVPVHRSRTFLSLLLEECIKDIHWHWFLNRRSRKAGKGAKEVVVITAAAAASIAQRSLREWISTPLLRRCATYRSIDE